MLYLDSSALIKHYVREPGTERVDDKLRGEVAASKPILTSVLTFTEIHAALVRRARDKSLSSDAFVYARTKFDSDWVQGLSAVDLGPGILSIVRNIVDQFALRGADTVHLASAIWLRDSTDFRASSDPVIFLTSDKQLAKAATKSRLDVFNPETAKQSNI